MIFVRTLQGRTLTLEADPCSNVLSIKNKIAEIEGIPVEDQRIFHNGELLVVDFLVTFGIQSSGYLTDRKVPRILDAEDGLCKFKEISF